LGLYLNGKKLKLMFNDEGFIFQNPFDIRFSYVSLGDSIAAGHAINEEWSTKYGTESQYGKNGNDSTVIVPNSYTDLIKNELEKEYGKKRISVKSFARSGDAVRHLMEKLDHDVVKNAIEKANLVTVCIGANDILGCVSESRLYEYINTGSLDNIEAEVVRNLNILDDDSNSNSYTALFNKLKSINPDAKYVFTTIYNPYKYLWIDEGKNGFFAPVLSTIPDINIISFDIDNIIKNSLLDTKAVKQLFDRVNGLGEWVEKYVGILNNVLKNNIRDYNNQNFIIVDTKALFDTVPDRPVLSDKHYNDLVNVEYTRGYNTLTMDWRQLYKDSGGAYNFWWDLANKYLISGGLNIEGLAGELVQMTVEKVITPDLDPHPESYGHYTLKRSFADALGWYSLDRYTITFDANGGSGSMNPQNVVSLDGLPAFANLSKNTFTHSVEGYRLLNWNTKPDGSGVSYTDGQIVGITSDLTLYAQWSNLYAITHKHTNHTNLYGDDETGHMECYALWIAGTEMPDLGRFSDYNTPTYYRPYGTRVGVVVSNYNPSELIYDDCTCDVYMNGVNVASGYRGTAYEFTLTSDVVIEFRWKIAGSVATFDAKSWEDCYITTL
jgi:hypothetical protein